MFSVRYGLDASQKETAQSVLRECRDRANAYREKHKAEFEEIAAKMKELRESRSKEETTKESLQAAQKSLEQLRDRKKELEKPIAEGIFNEFKQRLEQIPTKEQKAAFEQKEKARLESLRERMREDQGGRKATEPAEGKSQPPATAPAAAR